MTEAAIILIDDEQDNLDFLAEILSETDYETQSFSDPREALENIKAAPPELVFLDVQMPGMNGFEVLSEIRNTPHLSSTPVVLLSAIGAVTGESYEAEDIEKRYGVRPDAFVPKPILPDKVLAIVEQLLGAK